MGATTPPAAINDSNLPWTSPTTPILPLLLDSLMIPPSPPLPLLPMVAAGAAVAVRFATRAAVAGLRFERAVDIAAGCNQRAQSDGT